MRLRDWIFVEIRNIKNLQSVFASHSMAKQSNKDEIPSSLRFSERLNIGLGIMGYGLGSRLQDT